MQRTGPGHTGSKEEEGRYHSGIQNYEWTGPGRGDDT